VSLPRRGLAWAVTLGSIAALGLLLLLAPPIRDYESFECHTPGAFAGYLAEHPGTWLAVRGPQIGGPFLSYDAASGTTVVTAGCGHQSGDSFRVQGDLRAAAPTRLLLHRTVAPTDAGSPNATSTSTTSSTFPYATTGAPPAPPVGGLYAPVSLLPRLLATWAILAGLAVGLVLLLTPVPATASWGPAAGLLAGAAMAWWLQEDGGGSNSLLVFLLLVPLACLVAAGFAVGAVVARRVPTRMLVRLAIALLALGFLVQWFGFLQAFPTAPSA
jgi:hypothetical protein